MKTVFSLLMIAFVVGCSGRQPAKTSHKGTLVPDFSLFLADSSTYFKTSSLQGGKPAVFFYFGPGCPYCRGQMEELIANGSKLKDIQFVLLTTSPFEEMKWFYKHYQLEKYHNMIIGVDYTNFFGNYFNTNIVPYIAIYDRNRKLKEVFEGRVAVKQLRSVALDL